MYRTTNWTCGLVINYPHAGGLGIANYCDKAMTLHDANAVSFYKINIFSQLQKQRVLRGNAIHSVVMV